MTWVQGNVDKLQYWANGANLILSTCKTKYMLSSSCKFSSHHELNNTDFDLSVGTTSLERVSSAKLLGPRSTTLYKKMMQDDASLSLLLSLS